MLNLMKKIAALVLAMMLVLSVVYTAVAEKCTEEAFEVETEEIIETAQEETVEIEAAAETVLEEIAEVEENENVAEIETEEANVTEEVTETKVTEASDIEEEVATEEVTEKTVSITMNADSYCYGDTVILTAQLEGFEDAAYSIQWQYNNGNGWTVAEDLNGESSCIYTIDAANSNYSWKVVIIEL